MLTNKQMVDKGYSKAFRCCFDLLAKYADADDKPATWDQCCAEAAGILFGLLIEAPMSEAYEDRNRKAFVKWSDD